MNYSDLYNNVTNNRFYGIYCDEGSSLNKITLNDFYGNNVAGSSQGYDSGSENDINSNYWNDHNSNSPYLIDGSANNQDSSPLPVPVNQFTPEPSSQLLRDEDLFLIIITFLIIIILSITGVLIIIHVRNKTRK